MMDEVFAHALEDVKDEHPQMGLQQQIRLAKRRAKEIVEDRINRAADQYWKHVEAVNKAHFG